MPPQSQYQMMVNQVLYTLRHDFDTDDTLMDCIETAITGTDAFRNDVLAAQRVVDSWHGNLADVATDIVECGRGAVEGDLLVAFASLIAASLHTLEAGGTTSPKKSPAERYAAALASLFEVNAAAAEAEVIPQSIQRGD